jgi:hypothetical protein
MPDYRIFDEGYYLHGKETGKSLYENYRWLPDLTLPFCRRIAEYLNFYRDDYILDFGCARGYCVKAFKRLGYCAFGYDPSEWAIQNCDPEVKDKVTNSPERWKSKTYDWVIAKDVLEHIPDEELPTVIDDLTAHARKGVFVVVPLSPATGEPYVIPEYEHDITHVQRLDMLTWIERLRRSGFSVSGEYLVEGVKQNYSQYAQGNGFITLRRMK